MICKKCNAVNRDGASRCSLCGAPLSAGVGQSSYPWSAPSSSPQANPWENYRQSSASSRPDANPQPQQNPWTQPGPASQTKQYPLDQTMKVSQPPHDPWAQPAAARDPWTQPDPISQTAQPLWSQPATPPQDPWTNPNPVPQQPPLTSQSSPAYRQQPKKNLLPLIIIAGVLGVLVIIAAVIAIVLAGKSKADESPAAAEITVEETEEDTETVSVVVTGEQTDYDAACAQMDAGNYRQAAEMFEALGDFSDSADLAEECLQEADYADARSMLDAGDYQGAAELLEQLGDFKDSSDLLAQCSLCLPQSAVDEMDSYFRQTLQDTFNGSDWRYDTLSDMELLGYYEIISKTNGPSDNYVYLLYRITAYNSYVGKTTDYYWFGCYEDVAISDSGAVSQTSRTCFTNGAGSAYRIYVSGSGQFYYYGFETRADFEADHITPLESNYFWTWTDAE